MNRVILVPWFYILLIVVCITAVSATYDYVKINDAQNIIIQNQVKGNQSIKEYINCLLKINYTDTANIATAEQACLDTVPRVTK